MMPVMDEQGYPTDATLEQIERWPYQDVNGCLDFIRAAWHWSDWTSEAISAHEAGVIHADKADRYARFATGGWSGNEELLAALKRNRLVHLCSWQLSARGGLHIYRYQP